MSRVVGTALKSCHRNRLAGAGAGPDRGVVGDSSESQAVGPATEASEEVALARPGNVIWGEVTDAPFVNRAGGDVAGGDEVAQLGRWVAVELVVEGRH